MAKKLSENAKLKATNLALLEELKEERLKNKEQKKTILRFREVVEKASPDFKIQKGIVYGYTVWLKRINDEGHVRWDYSTTKVTKRAAIKYALKHKKEPTEFTFI